MNLVKRLQGFRVLVPLPRLLTLRVEDKNLLHSDTGIMAALFKYVSHAVGRRKYLGNDGHRLRGISLREVRRQHRHYIRTRLPVGIDAQVYLCPADIAKLGEELTQDHCKDSVIPTNH